jgi:hypothetical protein
VSILVDYCASLLANLVAAITRAVKVTLGRDRYRHFRAYLEAGGLDDIVSEVGATGRVSARTQIPDRCHQAIVWGER